MERSHTKKQNGDFFYLIRLLLRGYKDYKSNIAILTILGFLSGFVESIGITAVIPLFSFITGGGGKTFDTVSQFIGNSFAFFGITYNLKYLLIFIVLLFVFRAIMVIISNYIQIKIGADYEEVTRNNLFKKMLRADWPYLLRQRLGHLETILITNVQYAQKLLGVLADTLNTVATLLVYVVVVFNISSFTISVTLLLCGLVFILFRPLIFKTRILAKEAEYVNKEASHHINENIVGMKTVKAMLVDSAVADIGQLYFEKIKKLKVKIFLLRVIPGSLMQPIGLIFVVVLFAISYKTPGFSIGILAASVYLIQRIFIYAQQLQSNLNFINEGIPYLQKILSYEEQAFMHKESEGGEHPFIFGKDMEFRDVSFSYNEKQSVLKKVNFLISQGEMVGLIGPSGGGKTTIVDLMLRLFKPGEGQIFVDGVEIEDISLSDWRKNIGYVSQDIFLKNNTISDNIRFYNDTITDEDVVESAKMANIHEFIEALPQKYETIVGERGIMLSAGQRQRIVIARVLARKPKLLILDEATSALDNESEAEIQTVIEKFKGRLTVLAIAHRLSTIINSDRILVLENGNITEYREPKELLKDENSYLFKVYNIRK